MLHSGITAAGLALTAHRCPNRNIPVLRFGLVTDSHYADRDPGGTRYYRQSLTKMRECIDVFNSKTTDFIIHLGDFKDQDSNADPANTLKYLEALEAEFARFNGPRYHCVGNHDVDSITKRQFLSNIENTGISKTESYFHFEHRGFRFVVLDANYHEDGRDHFYLEGANWQDIRIPENQLEWLQETLAASRSPAIVFCHHPTFKYLHGESVYHIQNYQAVQRIFKSSGKVAAVFHGHTHQDTHQQIEGIHYLTMLGMVDHSGVENNAYALVEVYGDGRMEVIGYRRVKNKSLI